LHVTDREWQRHVGAMLRLSQSAVVPVYFPGRNSVLFTMANLLHPFLGTALLPLELARRKGQSFRVVIGEARPAARLASMGGDQALMKYLKQQTYFLSHRMTTRGLARIALAKKTRPSSAPRKIIAPIPKKRLADEIQSLPPEQQLARQGRFGVYYAEATQAPHLLNEIGRLRETTFREVGEGTGQPVDLDRFDPHYLHLFLWNHERGELAGAYRLGLTDRLLQTCGLAGLYTTTLFRFKPELLQELTPAIELGRAFVRSAYQRHHACLFLLWRGIGQFIVRHPQYHKLFGPVSISQEYQKISRDLMIRYLRANKMDQRLARLVTPRQPVRIRSRRILKDPTIDKRCHNPEDIAILVSELEEDGKGLPVLLRQYLKLNATLLSFNLDKTFSNVVDGLVFLDLTRTASPMVKRVMGKDGYRQFCAFHRLDQGDRFRKAG
jgi:putative hemolysin